MNKLGKVSIPFLYRLILPLALNVLLLGDNAIHIDRL